MQVFTHVSQGFSCNTYLCCDEKSGENILIDPGISSAEVLEFLNGRKVTKILLTHGHFDHVAAAEELRLALGAKVYAHREEAPLLADGYKNASLLVGMPEVRCSADVLLEEGDGIPFGDGELQVLHTPGHTPGGVCFFDGENLFCGDTLFAQGWGRCDLYGGDERALFASLARLRKLKGEITVFSGHGDSFMLSWRIAQTEG